MARFTVALNTIVRNVVMEGQGSISDYASHDRLIDLSLPVIFNFDYPIFDETYRRVLERKIIKHYYTREISETPYQMWNFRLNTLLNEIMPKYNQLYELNLKNFDIFGNVDITETLTKQSDEIGNVEKENESSNANTGISTSKSTAVNTDKNVYSDTPSSKVGDVDYATNITDLTGKNVNDLTSDITNVSNLTGTDTKVTNIKTTEDYVKTLKGKNNFKSNTEMLVEARNAVQNLDMQIIKDLSELFFMIYI